MAAKPRLRRTQLDSSRWNKAKVNTKFARELPSRNSLRHGHEDCDLNYLRQHKFHHFRGRASTRAIELCQLREIGYRQRPVSRCDEYDS
jgi:hypothetical protein